MKLEQLNFNEEPLSREEMFRIRGGVSALYTITNTGDCSDTGSPTTADCPDVAKDANPA